jgi:hypothetical protein
MSQLKQSLAAAVKAERSCALKDKAAWAEERAKLERQLVQTKTKIDRAEREKRDRETLAVAKKAEREKRAQGKGAWHMKKGERAGAVIPPVTVTLTMQGPSETCFSSHASRPSRRAEARWRSRRRWTRSGKRSLPRRRRVVLVCSRACPRSECIPSTFACARQPAWWRTPRASVTDQVDTERTVSRWNFSQWCENQRNTRTWLHRRSVPCAHPPHVRMVMYHHTSRHPLQTRRDERASIPSPDLSTALAGTALHALLGHLGDVGTAGRLGRRLLGLLLSLLRLGLGDGGLSGGGSDLGLSGSLGEDGSKVGTDDTSLRGQ